MNAILPCVLFLLLVTQGRADADTGRYAQPVNAVIGDESTANTEAMLSESERIARHLEYVEVLLRRATPADNTARHQVLDRLRAYRLANRFPRNVYQEGRAPVFVDDQGQRCAVGAIAEPDIGSAEVMRIAETERLSYVGEIDSPILLQWAKDIGFSVRELAMIQPTYDSGGSPEVPQDPSAVRQASRRLARSWRRCRVQAYPADVGWGSQRIASEVSFVKDSKKRELVASLKLQPVLLPDGRPDPEPAKELVSFLACVQEGFGTQSEPRTSYFLVGRSFGIAVPDNGGPIIRPDDGGLGVGPASAHLMHELQALRERCNLPRQRNQFQVRAQVKADGEVGELEVSAFRADTKDTDTLRDARQCIARELPGLLRFPASADGGSIAAVGP